jgi:protein gp37
MSDLFHEDVPDIFIINALAVMAEASQHIFLLLTKRPERMKEIMTHDTIAADVWLQTSTGVSASPLVWPLPNVWLGVTAENQEYVSKRVPVLLQIPAAARFVSVEPMLGPVDLESIQFDRNTQMNILEGCGVSSRAGGQMIPNAFCEPLNWVICGGESGPGARPMHPDWVRDLRDQCQAAGVPFLFKQWGEYCHPDQMPPETYRQVDAAHNLSGHGNYNQPWRVGKNKAGRLLDGQGWNQFPEVFQ